jgi:hypothetical protein
LQDRKEEKEEEKKAFGKNTNGQIDRIGTRRGSVKRQLG